MNISSINNLASHLTSTTQANLPAPPTPEQKNLIQAVKAVNAADLMGGENELSFVIDRAARIAVVRIVNKKTREVVQQIPNEHVLKLAEEASGRSNGTL